jgi:hypothetical protein
VLGLAGLAVTFAGPEISAGRQAAWTSSERHTLGMPRLFVGDLGTVIGSGSWSMSFVSANSFSVIAGINGSKLGSRPLRWKGAQHDRHQQDEPAISRDELLNQVWGCHRYPTTRTIDTHIFRLRHKLEKDPVEPVHFCAVHGAGYKFVD